MAKLLQKLYVVIWKNAIIRRRHWALTIFEILVPTFIVLLMASYFSFQPLQVDTQIYESKEAASLLKGYFGHFTSEIYYTPTTSFTDKLMNRLKNSFVGLQKCSIIGVQNEKDIVNAYENSTDDGFLSFYGVIFENVQGDTLPTSLKYRLRSKHPMYIQESFPVMAEDGPNQFSEQYVKTGVGALQLYIDDTFISMVRNEKNAPHSDMQVNRLVQRFPYPKSNLTATQSLMNLLSMMIVISFSFLCSAVLKRIVEEKETGVKELMKLMGLKTWMLWTGWFINALFVNFISVTIIVIFVKYPVLRSYPLIQLVDVSVLWVFFFLFCVTAVCSLFAISAFFESATFAVSFGIILWFILYIALFYFDALVEVSSMVKSLTCLTPHGALIQGMNIISQYEIRGIGLSWNNLFTPPSGGGYDDLSMGNIFILCAINIILCVLITSYVDAIKPGKYGIAKPWYLCFGKLFSSKNSVESKETHPNLQRNFEPPPENLQPGIQIKNLYKVYTSLRKSFEKVAVNGVTIDIYDGEITALLGHNGAGKTTVMSILAGMFSPTSGSVVISGYDIQHKLDKIRDNLGLCPQHNLHFADLTVKQHLLFFAMLKGLSKKSANSESEALINQLNLEDKKHKLPSQLSGGMKRKLSLAIALTGDAKILLLDEPTSGMDPEVRRQVWDMLLSMRGHKTILLSTHYMEEADVLGDRIAIMDHGKVKCFGTSLFLKKLYGSGYSLSVIKADGCKESAVWDTVSKTIPGAAINNLMGAIMTFTLPSTETSKFPTLFDALEGNKNNLKIAGIGVSITTLEEVFLNVGKESEEEGSENGSYRSEANDESRRLVDVADALTSSRVTGVKLMFRQFSAILMNRILFIYREWFTYIVKILIALLCVITSVLVTSKIIGEAGGTVELPAHLFSLNDYGKTEVFVQSEGCNKDLLNNFKNEIAHTSSKLNNANSSKSIIDTLLEEGTLNIVKFRDRMIVAGVLNCQGKNIQANALYSNVAFHGFPISVNIMTNTLLKFFSSSHSVVFSYQPFKFKESEQAVSSLIFSLLWAILVPLGLLLVVSNYAGFHLLERVSKAKHLQFMAGVNPITYWLASFLWDFFTYLVFVIVILICVIVCDGHGTFTGSEPLGFLFLILVLYGFSAIPFTHIGSFILRTVTGTFNLLVTLNLVVGFVLLTTVYIMEVNNNEDSKVIEAVCRIVPHFTFLRAIFKYTEITINKMNCVTLKQPNCETEYSYIVTESSNTNSLYWEVIFFVVDGLLYFFILLLIEFGFIDNLKAITVKVLYRKKVRKSTLDDEDVRDEEHRIKVQSKGSQPDDILLVQDLIKKFCNFPAVKGLSFGVKEGECFGLLGVNGAGKTTTFEMLTGSLSPTSGDASIYQHKLSRKKRMYLSHIGYCPQFDALNEHLTGYEHILMFAKLRGVPDDMISSQVESWLRLLGLGEYSKKLCGTYSGGNKRKLSTAIALIGNPPVVFLDEPTSGVDPVSRRKLWDVLGKIHKTGQAVVLTSHSMEECEVLCTRLAIMVAGQFMCLGNIQYLKQKFGQGFTVVIKLKATATSQQQISQLKSVFQQQFDNKCIIKDEHVGLLHYHITDPAVQWKKLFGVMEQLKKDFKIVEDYAIGETTLEQIFLSFARAQETEEPASV